MVKKKTKVSKKERELDEKLVRMDGELKRIKELRMYLDSYANRLDVIKEKTERECAWLGAQVHDMHGAMEMFRQRVGGVERGFGALRALLYREFDARITKCEEALGIKKPDVAIPGMNVWQTEFVEKRDDA